MKYLVIALAVFMLLLAARSLQSFSGENMNVEQLKKIIDEGTLSKEEAAVVDVREPDEFAGGHIKGAVNIPVGSVGDNIEKIKKYKKVYVICLSGARSAMACKIISGSAAGVAPVNITGGMSAWYGAGYAIEK